MEKEKVYIPSEKIVAREIEIGDMEDELFTL